MLWYIFLHSLFYFLEAEEHPLLHKAEILNEIYQMRNDSNHSKGYENLTRLIEIFKQNYPVELWKKSGYFTEDYIKEINLHWLRFVPPAKGHFYGLAVLYFFIMIMGLCGNVLVIHLFIRCKSLRTPANSLVVNLAVSDLVMMLMIPIFIYNCLHFGPVLGDIGCKFYGFLGAISGTVSICTLAAISLDRFYVIKYPLQRQSNHMRVKIFLVIAWIYGATFSLIPVLNIGLGSYVPEGYLVSCSFDYLTPNPNVKYFIFSFFVAAWCIPFVAICYSYVNIIYVVIVKRNLAKDNVLVRESSRHVKEEAKRKQELKLSLIVLLVIGLWFLSWTPYALIALLGIAGKADVITPLASMVPALFCKSASCLDPYVYALTHPRFKAELRSLFCRQSDASRISRVWLTSERRSTRQGTGMGDRGDVIEEMVMVDLSNNAKALPRPTLASAGQMTFENIDQEMKKNTTLYKPSWWLQPSFSNKSSVRRLVRTFSGHGKSGGVDED